MTSLTEIKDDMMPTGGVLLSETEMGPGVYPTRVYAF